MTNCRAGFATGHNNIKQVQHSRVLGIEINVNLSWNKHIENVVKKVTSGIGAMRRIRDFVDRETLSSIYNALIRPHFDYCSEVPYGIHLVWGSPTDFKNCRIELQE